MIDLNADDAKSRPTSARGVPKKQEEKQEVNSDDDGVYYCEKSKRYRDKTGQFVPDPNKKENDEKKDDQKEKNEKENESSSVDTEKEKIKKDKDDKIAEDDFKGAVDERIDTKPCQQTNSITNKFKILF